MEETKLTKKFITGAVLVAISLILGKLVLIPLIFSPGDEIWRMSMLTIYIFSWVILIIGIVLCGMEGYRLVKRIYKDYQQKTISQVKHHSKRAAQKTVEVLASRARSRLDKIRKRPDQP